MTSPRSPVLVKICGVTRDDDVDVCARAGATWIGLNLWPGSKRYVPLTAAHALAARAHVAPRPQGLSPLSVVVLTVGATAEEAARAVRTVGAQVLQLHGDETPNVCQTLRQLLPSGTQLWKALAVAVPADVTADALRQWPVDALVLDAPSAGRGGSGVPIVLSLARAAVAASPIPIILAGGLRPDTVGAAIDACTPWAVDVASGVESHPGVKDATKVATFVAQAGQRTAR